MQASPTTRKSWRGLLLNEASKGQLQAGAKGRQRRLPCGFHLPFLLPKLGHQVTTVHTSPPAPARLALSDAVWLQETTAWHQPFLPGRPRSLGVEWRRGPAHFPPDKGQIFVMSGNWVHLGLSSGGSLECQQTAPPYFRAFGGKCGVKTPRAFSTGMGRGS